MMKLALLVRFLTGSKDAILEVAASRTALFPAFLFVLSAGFAREYDGEDIMSAPWHFVRPLGASLGTATVLFLVVHLHVFLNRRKAIGEAPTLGQAYRRFLTLFWWTAPMAWLYAIPYERGLDAVDSMIVNLWTLALVALWRVLLMTRVVQVVYGIGLGYAFLLVMIFADAVAFAILTLIPGPVMGLMGGIRYMEQDQILATARFALELLTVLGFPVLLIGWALSFFRLKPRWPELVEGDTASMRGPRRLGLAAILVWIPIMPFTQVEQRERTRAETMLADGDVIECMRYLSTRQAGDLPPHWNPPPRIYGDREREHFIAVCEALHEETHADWVRNLFMAKIEISEQSALSRRNESWAGILRSLEGTADYLDLRTRTLGEKIEWIRDDLMILELLQAYPRERSTDEAASLEGVSEILRLRLSSLEARHARRVRGFERP